MVLYAILEDYNNGVEKYNFSYENKVLGVYQDEKEAIANINKGLENISPESWSSYTELGGRCIRHTSMADVTIVRKVQYFNTEDFNKYGLFEDK